MLRILKKVSALALIGFAVQSASAFSLLGPLPTDPGGEPWQVAQISYQFPGDIGGPHNIAEGYRRNTPVMFYTESESFFGYFHSNGVHAVEAAFNVFNNLTNVSAYSRDLIEFPMESQRPNFRAQALALFDLKSDTMSILTEQMGLASPTRWTWALHDRLRPNGTRCPEDMIYTVIKRNFDVVPSAPSEFQNSSYVNGTLYSYDIVEFCTGTPWLADAVEFPVDPLANSFTAVADFGLLVGGFYTGLTRDDVGGLRYLWQTNNINFEAPGPDTVGFVTNGVSEIPIITQDLGLLLARAATNNAAALQALYPGLIDTSTLIGFGLATNVQIVGFVFNFPPNAPAGVFTVTPVTNITVGFFPKYSHTLNNVITNTLSPRSFVTIETISLTNVPFAPAGTVRLRSNIRHLLTNSPTGDFFLLPTNVCAVRVLSNILATTIATTNTIIATNIGGGTNGGFGEFFIQNTITYFTNHALAYLSIDCPPNPVGDYQGVERVRFVHVPRNLYNSLSGLYRIPITNDYTLVSLDRTNLVWRPIKIRRVITQPDILLTAVDGIDVPGNQTFGVGDIFRDINFNSGFVQPETRGPGTIEAPTTLAYDKGGPSYFNFALFGLASSNVFLSELDQFPALFWGSFDGSTNAPIVYPNGATLDELENSILLGISNPNLPTGTVGEPYSAHVAVVGAQPPFTVALAPGSPGLPPGLGVSSSGLIAGTPSEPGVFDFDLRLTDSAGHTVDVPFALTIN